MTKTLTGIAASSVMMALLPQYAAAQDGLALEEVVVTARKVEENIQRTPVAVTALTSSTIENLALTSLDQIDHLAPNLQVSPGYSGSGSGANFYIRGIGQTDFIATSDPGVSLYLDGVYLGRTIGAAIDTADIARIEVLKGPQGTLFGKNTIGGAINVISQRPDPSGGSYVEATLGNFNRTDARFSTNLALSDTLTAKVSGAFRKNDGFAKRELDGARLGDAEDVSGRVQVLWRAGDSAEVLFSADGSRRRAHIAAHGATHVAASAGGDYFEQLTGLNVLDFPPSADPRRDNTTSVRPNDDVDVLGASLEATWNLGGLDLKSITAYRTMDSESASDFDGTLAIYNDQEVSQDQDQVSQEFQLSGATERIKWLLGAYFLQENIDESITNRYYAYYAFLPYGAGATQFNHLETRSYAAFGQASIQLTQRLSATVGARWTQEEKESTLSNLDLDAPFRVTGKERWDDVSPRFGLEFQATDDLMLYASATQGFKSGSFNGRPAAGTQFTAYDPEKVLSYEVGLKSQWLDDRVRVNMAGFLNQYEDIQLLTVGVDSGGNLFFPVDNAGDADITGFELELQARATDRLTLTGSIGNADESWQRIAPVALVTEQTRLPSLSHWNWRLGVQYEQPLGNHGSLLLGGDYSKRSSYYQTTINSPFEKEDGYGLLNAFMRYTSADGRWELNLWGRNLTDETYIAWAQDLIAIGDSHTSVWFGRPREYGATLRFNF